MASSATSLWRPRLDGPRVVPGLAPGLTVPDVLMPGAAGTAGAPAGSVSCVATGGPPPPAAGPASAAGPPPAGAVCCLAAGAAGAGTPGVVPPTGAAPAGSVPCMAAGVGPVPEGAASAAGSPPAAALGAAMAAALAGLRGGEDAGANLAMEVDVGGPCPGGRWRVAALCTPGPVTLRAPGLGGSSSRLFALMVSRPSGL